MPAPRDRAALIKAARMYFLDGRSQDDVARALGTSRSNVSRMLTAARAQGIVEIRVHDQTSREKELEQALQERFELVACPGCRLQTRVDALAAAGDLAAQWLDESCATGRFWGSRGVPHCRRWSSRSRSTSRAGVEVLPLIGGLSTADSLVAGQELVRELAGRLGATYRYLHAPALLRSETARDALLAEPTVAEVLERAKAADIAMVGIGSVGTGSSSEMLHGLGLTRCRAKGVSGKRADRRHVLPLLRCRRSGSTRGGARPRSRGGS